MKKKHVALHHCVKCYQRIFRHYRFRNDGICPHCGNDSGGTICDTYKNIVEVDVEEPKTVGTLLGCGAGFVVGWCARALWEVRMLLPCWHDRSQLGCLRCGKKRADFRK